MGVRRKRGNFDDDGGPKPQGSWLFGMVVGLALTNLAAGAVMYGTGAAISEALICGPGASSIAKKG